MPECRQSHDLETAPNYAKMRTGVRVRVFPTGPVLVLPQLAHGIQNDVVCIQQGIAARACGRT